jgi:hypothetical protein
MREQRVEQMRVIKIYPSIYIHIHAYTTLETYRDADA